MASNELRDKGLVEPLEALLLINIAASLVPKLGIPVGSVAMCVVFCGSAGPAMFWPKINAHFNFPGLEWRTIDCIAGPEHDMTSLRGVLFAT